MTDPKHIDHATKMAAQDPDFPDYDERGWPNALVGMVLNVRDDAARLREKASHFTGTVIGEFLDSIGTSLENGAHPADRYMSEVAGPALASPSVPAPPQWQPIETAPTDATRIMLAVFRDPPSAYQASDYYHLATWDGEACHPYIPNKWTHWMPLPPAPGAADPSPPPEVPEGMVMEAKADIPTWTESDISELDAALAQYPAKAPGPTVDDLQRELLAICKGRDNYETWARVSGQPINERVNEVKRMGNRRAVHELRLQIHAINPNAALYFGWCPGEDGPTSKAEFFAAAATRSQP